jgi:hypothetical protein
MENDQVIDPALSQVTEAEPEQTAPQVDGTEPQSDENTPAEKTFTQAELDAILEKKTAKLIRQREQERATRKAIEQQIARVQPQQATEGKPQLAQFSDPEQYAEAVSNWKLEQMTHQQRAAQAQQSQGEFNSKRDDLMAELEDADGFDQRKFDKLPISRTMAEAIVDSDQGVKLTVHLVNHPEEASRIAALSPARQAAELGKLEAKLSATPVKKPSNAPAPITPVGAKGSSVTTNLYDPKLANDPEAWIAARRAQRAAKR